MQLSLFDDTTQEQTKTDLDLASQKKQLGKLFCYTHTINVINKNKLV